MPLTGMRYYIGTSGWSYHWNEGGTLPWYVERSGLNAIELNASFYRFPRPSYVTSWRDRGKDLKWSIKVHRSITHNRKFNDQAFDIWGRFRERFSPLDDITGCYLFQAPPRFKDIDRILRFLDAVNLGNRLALELRDAELLADDAVCTQLQEHAILVSVDSPDFQNRIFHGDTIYLRMHGREDWYYHDYTRRELEETLELIVHSNPDTLYVFFNNNHHMLENAQVMRDLLQIHTQE